MPEPDLIPHLPDGTPIPTDALEWSFTRSSGPGGQHVNRSATRVQLTLDLARIPDPVARALHRRCSNRIDTADRLTVAYGGTRSQLQNRRSAVAKLEELLRLALRPRKRRIATRIPRGVKQRRLETKRHRARIKGARGRVRNDD